MPLDRAHITVASRIMLPTYVGLAAAYGLVYLFDPLHRLQFSHSLDVPRRLVGGSMKPWGLLFIALAALMWLAFHYGSRQTFLLGLCVNAAAWILWAAMYTTAIFTDPRSSILAPAAPLFYLAACLATSRSLLTRER